VHRSDRSPRSICAIALSSIWIACSSNGTTANPSTPNAGEGGAGATPAAGGASGTLSAGGPAAASGGALGGSATTGGSTAAGGTDSAMGGAQTGGGTGGDASAQGGAMTSGGSPSTAGGPTNTVMGYTCPNVPKPVCNSASPTSYVKLTGSTGVHDPEITADANCNFYVFATGSEYPSKKSTDLVAWTNYSANGPAPTVAAGNQGIWAADAHYVNGKIWDYYSIWRGSIPTAQIGLLTNESLDPSSPNYKWNDEGLVVDEANGGGNNVNVIDPDLFVDEDGSFWLIYGSFNNGVRLIALNPDTGLPKTNPVQPTVITDHLGEGSSLMKNHGYYYVAVSRGKCCSGTSSSYEVIYARSKSITGPYLTKSGQSFATSAYTDSTDALMPVGFEGDTGGQGGQAFFRVNGQWYIVYHAYVAGAAPALLVVRPIYFDSSDWMTFDCTKAAN
jgi:arabinan endo-1,5-alpha-L-arabinosidase